MADIVMELQSNIEELSKDIKIKNKQIEKLNQDLHQATIALGTKEHEGQHLKQENDQLLSDIQILKKTTKEDVSKKVAAISKEFREKLEDVESQLDASRCEIEELKEQLNSHAQSGHNSVSNADEVETLQKELTNLSEEYAMLFETRTARDKELAEYVAKEATFMTQLEEEKQNSTHLREKCESLKDEVNSLKEELELAQVHAQETRLELQSTNKEEVDLEEDGKRGNSLFSEVEDNRQAAINALKQSRVDLLKAKQDLTRANAIVQNIKMENVKLHEQWKEHEMKGLVLQFEDGELKTQYEQIIQELKNEIAVMAKKLQEKAPTCLPDPISTWKWVESLQEDHQKSQNEIHSKLMELKLKMLFKDENCLAVERRERQTAGLNVQLQGQIKELKLSLERLNNGQPLQLGKVEAPKSEVSKRPAQPERQLPSFMIKKTQPAKSVQFAPLSETSSPNKNPLFSKIKTENQENVRPKKRPVSIKVVHIPSIKKT